MREKAVWILDMPKCCDECPLLEDYGDYPRCIAIGETRGYTFKTREYKMDRCPLLKMPKEWKGEE